MMGLLYRNAPGSATGTTALRRKIRNFLRLLGGSRQDIAFHALKAAVFTRACPASTDHPEHDARPGCRFPFRIGLSRRVDAVRMA